MKFYCVTYDTPPVNYDTTITAASKKEAIAKVKEVIPDAYNFVAWELKGNETVKAETKETSVNQ